MELLIAVISAAVALTSVAISSRANRQQAKLAAELDQRSTEQARELARHDVMSRHRDQLLRAAFDLQSRAFNISAKYFLLAYHRKGRERDREYARTSTLYVFGEYLGWVEIIRRRVQFLDFGEQEVNRQVMNHFMKIAVAMTEDGLPDRHFLVWRANQRGIGEVMITGEDGAERCIGYAEFCERLKKDPEFATWFETLEESLDAVPKCGCEHPRLERLQNRLMDLIDLLDPAFERFPEHLRSRLGSEYMQA